MNDGSQAFSNYFYSSLEINFKECVDRCGKLSFGFAIRQDVTKKWIHFQGGFAVAAANLLTHLSLVATLL